ncbi:class I SAM-dependent methyltransferase [Dysgonomonas sp. ZJ709]|uniref:class I SAM-dependent methyltransferase n=1 Tax=Dysgonomonas sp. ZJ709 TaxID=2709797 RepID=UPI0013EE3ECE|nr:class I SAM-dependent methyltransferase [Dysgonomonas sp. ZJ709]
MNLSSATKLFIEEHENDDIRKLALQAKRYPEIDMQMAIQQIAGRQTAKEKIPNWYKNDELLYPKHISMEQCSSEHTAQFKADLFHGGTMVDLTGGFGIDFSFIAKNFKQATYVEQQPELVDIAAHNFTKLGLNNADVVNTDAIAYLEAMQSVDLIYIDPARRSSTGRKTALIEDCTPNIIEIEELLEQKAKYIMIKLSPMLDISLAIRSMRNISDVYIISVANECKELLFIKSHESKKTQLHCINILNNKIDQFIFSKEDEESTTVSFAFELGKYLYEPNSSITKGGAYKSIAKAFDLNKLHISSHLYTSDELHTDFYGRRFEITGMCSLNKKELKEYLLDIKQANITTRNFPLSTDELRKRTGLKDGGNLYIFATTLADDKKVLIFCKKI